MSEEPAGKKDRLASFGKEVRWFLYFLAIPVWLFVLGQKFYDPSFGNTPIAQLTLNQIAANTAKLLVAVVLAIVWYRFAFAPEHRRLLNPRNWGWLGVVGVAVIVIGAFLQILAE